MKTFAWRPKVPQPAINPNRGEIWLADLTPTRGHEQAGTNRPCLIVSVNEFNHGHSGMVIVAPITKADRGIPFQVPVTSNESGLSFDSVIMCDQVRAVSKERLVRPIGRRMPPSIMMTVEDRVKLLLNIK
jgi:mRNA interferase MazF